MPKVNLNLVFKSYYDSEIILEDWIQAVNCIYSLNNLVNNKRYIGQARWLYGRMIANRELSHWQQIDNGQYIHNSILKYGYENFELELLERDLSGYEEMNERESYWISYYDTYYIHGKGYNKTLGGNNCSHFQSEENIRKSHDTLYEIYGSRSGVLQSDDVVLKRSLTALFDSIDDRMVDLHMKNKAINAYNYIHNDRFSWRHLKNVFRKFKYLSKDPRFTDTIRNLLKEIYEYSYTNYRDWTIENFGENLFDGL